MSGLNGPCPGLPCRVTRDDEHARRSFVVKPDCDGPRQVSGRFGDRFDEVVGLDLEYTENRSVWQGLFFAFCTVERSCPKRGSCRCRSKSLW
jgi:lipopolysaccharide/colanic/teichoic acid biosynthesis glycosyltransferase